MLKPSHNVPRTLLLKIDALVKAVLGKRTAFTQVSLLKGASLVRFGFHVRQKAIKMHHSVSVNMSRYLLTFHDDIERFCTAKGNTPTIPSIYDLEKKYKFLPELFGNKSYFAPMTKQILSLK